LLSIAGGSANVAPHTQVASNSNVPSFHREPSLENNVMNLNSLRVLSLGNCKSLSDAGLSSLCFHELTDVLLDCPSKISDIGFGEFVAHHKNLTSVTVRNCPTLTGKGVSILATSCPNLKYLDLTDCSRIGDDALKVIANRCNNLCEFRMKNNWITSPLGLQHIFSATSALQSLHLSHCANAVTDAGILLLMQHQQNITLNGNKSPLQCETDRRFDQLHTFAPPGLRHLTLAGCGDVSSSALSALFAVLPNLVTLDCSDCAGMNDACLFEIASTCVQLTEINLSKCNFIGDAGTSALVQKLSLKILILSKTKVSHNIFQHFRSEKSGEKMMNESAFTKCVSYLEELDVSLCSNFADHGIVWLLSDPYRCRSLKHLNVKECIGITDVAIKAIATYLSSPLIHKNADLESSIHHSVQHTDEDCSNNIRRISIPSMISLNLTKTRITDTGLRYFETFLIQMQQQASNLKPLQPSSVNALFLDALFVDACKITDDGVCSIVRAFPHLQVLSLNGCIHVSDLCMESLGTDHVAHAQQKLSSRHVDSIASVSSENIDKSRVSINAIHSDASTLFPLHAFSLAHTAVTDRGICKLFALIASRSKAHFSFVNKADDAVSNAINCGFCDIVSLDLEGCREISDASLVVLAPLCPLLTHLNLSNTNVTNKGISALVQHCKRLVYLNLSACKRIEENGGSAAQLLMKARCTVRLSGHY
jgi:hypothetical protein